MRLARALIVALLAGLAGAALVAGLWQANAAVRRAEGRLLEAETAVAARLLRETDGPTRVTRLLGSRWERLPETDPALGEPVIDVRQTGLVARAAVLDADGWDAVGQVVVREETSRRARPALAAWPVALAAVAGLFVVAAVTVHAASRRGPASLRAPLVIWAVAGLVLVALPLAVADRWANRALSDLTDRRLALGHDVLAARGDAAAMAGRPSAIPDLTGLRFVLAGRSAAQDAAPVAGFPAHVARALADTPLPADGRVRVDRVPWAAAAVGPVRLVMLPFEHTDAPRARLLGVAAAGVVAGLPLLVLASTLQDRRRLRRELVAWSFLAPAIVHLACFTGGPLAFAAWLSLHRWSLVDPARPFVGLGNYVELAGNDAFWNALWNTAVFTLHVPLSMAIALGLAMLVRRPGRASAVARAAFFLPSITSLVAVAMVWQWILNEEYGLANSLLEALGLPAVRWLSSPSVALISVMIVATWTSLGFQTVLLQAGLTAIPRELYDAARIDGASRWQRFRHVTLPGLRPTLFFVLITSVIGSFQVFATVYVMTQGGPLHATDVAVFHIYEEAWELQRVGSAAAMSWVLFAVIFIVTLLHVRALERRAA